MSDQSLRDALEKLQGAVEMIGTHDVIEGDVVPQREFWDVVEAARKVLAANALLNGAE